MSYRLRGYATVEELRDAGFIPPEELVESKAIAVSECIEMIPCNVCQSVCPVKAIRVEGLSGRPRIDWDRCTGCGVCVGSCPGQAMFMVGRAGNDYIVGLPYEFLPRAEKGKRAVLMGRDGRELGEGEITRVFEINKTQVVFVKVPRDLIWEVRSIRVK
ncbi:MAG: 4Fe-4S binding protein [Infirmifilum sp.]|uniref:Ferredoxin n=1 Tax=Infirmifilum uzonense TaxID=1550241 RepID=A0A0F7FII4_9CREN|nr:4Fe-4S binding protein [Infirmifilum uzonense]AKG38753.1 ferredoxin [Infirmifilum uzonense]